MRVSVFTIQININTVQCEFYVQNATNYRGVQMHFAGDMDIHMLVHNGYGYPWFAICIAASVMNSNFDLVEHPYAYA